MSENNKKKATDKKPTKDQQKIKKLENKIIELNKEIEDIKLNASKVINEFKNNSKNVQEQYESDYKYRSKSLLEDIIKHIDIFESALFPNKDVSPEFKNWLIGFEMVYTGIINSLSNEGMSEIQVKIGDIFNPIYHMAIDTVEDKTKKENEIIEIKQKGYTLHDRLIRPSIVVVINNKKEKKKETKKR